MPLSVSMADIAAAGDPETEGRHAPGAFGHARDRHRQITLDGMDAESRLVAMVLHAPGEDAHLVEVEWQAGLGGRENHHVFRHLVVGRIGVGSVILVST